MQKFCSKRDMWIVVILWGTMGLFAYSLFSIWTRPPSLISVIFSVVVILGAALVFWIMYGTYYMVDNHVLVARSGPFRYVIQIADIRQAVPSGDPTSSPAMSLDRIKISYGNPEQHLLVSPLQQNEFLKAINAGSFL